MPVVSRVVFFGGASEGGRKAAHSGKETGFVVWASTKQPIVLNWVFGRALFQLFCFHFPRIAAIAVAVAVAVAMAKKPISVVCAEIQRGS